MAAREIVFLMYHELQLPQRPLVQSEPGYVRYIVAEPDFRSQIAWLREKGWKGLSVSKALNYPDGKSVALTFDDGCETDLIAAAPILKAVGFNATFYVTAGFIGKPGHLSTEQLRHLHAMGFEIGCHSMTHAYLDDLSQADLKREIIDASKQIEDMLGAKIEHFSCPGGRYNARTLATAQAAGYRSLATSHPRANSPATDPYQLGRVAILRGMNHTTFERTCTGEALRKMQLSESARGATRKLLGNALYDRLRALLVRQE